jgi:hypothetical protein
MTVLGSYPSKDRPPFESAAPIQRTLGYYQVAPQLHLRRLQDIRRRHHHSRFNNLKKNMRHNIGTVQNARGDVIRLSPSTTALPNHIAPRRSSGVMVPFQRFAKKQKMD